jgi:hypothetical protein
MWRARDWRRQLQAGGALAACMSRVTRHASVSAVTHRFGTANWARAKPPCGGGSSAGLP